VHVSAGEEKLVTALMHSNQLMWAGLSPAAQPSPCSWARFGPTYAFGPDLAHLKKTKIFVSEFYNFPA